MTTNPQGPIVPWVKWVCGESGAGCGEGFRSIIAWMGFFPLGFCFFIALQYPDEMVLNPQCPPGRSNVDICVV